MVGPFFHYVHLFVDISGNAGNNALIQWIVDYFSPPTEIRRPTNLTEALMNPSVTCTEKMPIILQDGWHSRTVVGYEEISDSTVNLLVFDPSR